MPYEVQVCSEEDFPRFFDILSDAFTNVHPYVDSLFPSHWTPAGRKAGAERLLEESKTDPYTTFLKVVDPETKVIIATAKWYIYKSFIPDETASLSGDFWDNEDEKERAMYMYDTYMVTRRGAIRKNKGSLLGKDSCFPCRCRVSLRHFPLHPAKDHGPTCGTAWNQFGTSDSFKKGIEAIRSRLLADHCVPSLVLDILTVDPAHQRKGAGRKLVQWGTKMADELGVECVVEASYDGRVLYESEGFETISVVRLEYPTGRWTDQRVQEFLWMIRPAKKLPESQSAVPTDGQRMEKSTGVSSTVTEVQTVE